MDGDVRIRLISNNGLEMARKAVKTAEERHGEGLEEGTDAPIEHALERAAAVGHVVTARSWKESPLSY
jgi:hypothetical protein